MTIDFLISLEDITDTYTVFEKNQVLTDGQLNSVTDYLDDQQRLTRVELLGVGIVCGLWPSLEDGSVGISHGVGVTTDGDLMPLAEDTVYDRYKPYDRQAPEYRKFRTAAGGRIPLFELLPEGAKQDPASSSLRNFKGNEARELADMVVVLFMESWVRDDDECTGTDCDNKGRTATHILKALLTTPAGAEGLVERIKNETPDLEPIDVARAEVTVNLATTADFVTLYRNTCKAIADPLKAALRDLYPSCKELLRPVFPSDPASGWRARLDAALAAANDGRIQYCYDFLKDLAETYNAFCWLLRDESVCCPPFDAFPKHLLLGRLGSPASLRTGLYRSPLLQDDARQHARFLAIKLDALLRGYKPPNLEKIIRITPSSMEDRSLEERAIPYYYDIKGSRLPQAWSYELTRRGRAKANYGFRAGEYGGTAEPLKLQIGRHDFFRIEGHLGWKVGQALERLQALIKRYNLPIHLASVMLGKEPTKVLVTATTISDLDHIYTLYNSDLIYLLDEAAGFAGKLPAQLADAERQGDIVAGDRTAVERAVKGKARAVGEHASTATRLLKAGKTAEGRAEVLETVKAAAEVKEGIAPVSRDRFASPLDNLIVSPHWRLAAWVEEMLANRAANEATKLLLPAYLVEHPGLEHFAGVTRGGTFVLVYDEQQNVVADFMLPYACCERRVEKLPPPSKSPKKPDVLDDKPILITSALSTLGIG